MLVFLSGPALFQALKRFAIGLREARIVPCPFVDKLNILSVAHSSSEGSRAALNLFNHRWQGTFRTMFVLFVLEVQSLEGKHTFDICIRWQGL